MRLFDVMGALVVGAWVVLAGAYAVKVNTEDKGSVASKLSDKVTMSEGESWMILTRKDVDVGYIHETRTVVDDGWLLEYEMLTLVELMGVPQLIDTRMKATVDRDAVLRQFFGAVTSVIGTFEVRGEVKGLELTMTMDMQGGKREQKITLKQPPRLASNALNQILAGPAPRVGQVFEQEFFDPVSMGMNRLVYEFVEMKEVDTYEIKEMSYHFVQKVMGTELDVFVNKNGEILIQELPMYTVAAKIPNILGRSRAPIIRRDIEKKMTDAKITSPDDLMKQLEQQASAQGTSAPTREGLMGGALDFVGSAFGANAKADEPLAYVLEGLDQGQAWALTSSRQRLAAGEGWPPRVLVGDFAQEAHRAGTAPWSEARPDEAALGAMLVSDAVIDWQDAEIVAFAGSVGGAELGAADRARALARKIGDRVKLGEPAATSASAALKAGQGDARAQAWVLIAALRAQKIPARLVVGVLAGRDGASAPHVWVQAWDGAGFVELDPSREDFVPGQGHLQLAVSADVAGAPAVPPSVKPVLKAPDQK